jgi:hypothetical protein
MMMCSSNNDVQLRVCVMKPQCHLLSPIPQLSKYSLPPSQAKQCKGAPICPSIAYQGAKTLCIHMMGPRGDSHSQYYIDTPAELLTVRYG